MWREKMLYKKLSYVKERHYTIAPLHPAGRILSPIYGRYSYVTATLIVPMVIVVVDVTNICILH